MRRLGSVLGVALLGAVSAGSPAPAAAETRFFLIAELSEPCFHCDSYVLPLDDPNALAEALELIQFGPGEGRGGIVVAQIAPGADGINRDHLAPGSPAWSWHVTDFVDFAEFTIELCDGWPTGVENDVNGWIQNTGGVICFWSYSVVAEVLPGPGIPGLRGTGLLLLALLLALVGLWRLRPAPSP